MKRPIEILVLITAIALTAAACGGGPNTDATGAPGIEITFRSDPEPPKMGENTFEAMVMSNGQPVADADVSVELFMAAMPSMSMAEMRSSVPLASQGGGRYRGMGNVMTTGTWDATVSVKRGGQELGNKKVTLTAK